jgi:hypothetical protein
MDSRPFFVCPFISPLLLSFVTSALKMEEIFFLRSVGVDTLKDRAPKPKTPTEVFYFRYIKKRDWF